MIWISRDLLFYRGYWILKAKAHSHKFESSPTHLDRFWAHVEPRIGPPKARAQSFSLGFAEARACRARPCQVAFHLILPFYTIRLCNLALSCKFVTYIAILLALVAELSMSSSSSNWQKHLNLVQPQTVHLRQIKPRFKN